MKRARKPGKSVSVRIFINYETSVSTSVRIKSRPRRSLRRGPRSSGPGVFKGRRSSRALCVMFFHAETRRNETLKNSHRGAARSAAVHEMLFSFCALYSAELPLCFSMKPPALLSLSLSLTSPRVSLESLYIRAEQVFAAARAPPRNSESNRASDFEDKRSRRKFVRARPVHHVLTLVHSFREFPLRWENRDKGEELTLAR